MSQTFPLRGMPALALGAGFGTRLLPLTEHVPKPAIPVLGRPLIGYPLIHLYAGGCTDVWINAHHRVDRLKASLEPWVQRRLQSLRLCWSIEQPEILGTGGALRKLESELCGDGPILLLNGDSILGLDLPALVEAHRLNRKEGAVATLLCLPRADAERFGAVRVDDRGRVVDLAGLARRPGTADEEATAALATIFCGVHVLEPEVVRALPPDGYSCIVRQGYAPLIAAGADVRAVLAPRDLLFHDVGKPGRYLDAQAGLMDGGGGRAVAVAEGVDPAEALFQEATYAVDATGREYGSPGAVEGLAGARLEPPFFFGPANRVEPDAVIGPNASLGARNRVGAGATLRDVALWSGVEVPAGGRLEGLIAGTLGGEELRALRED